MTGSIRSLKLNPGPNNRSLAGALGSQFFAGRRGDGAQAGRGCWKTRRGHSGRARSAFTRVFDALWVLTRNRVKTGHAWVFICISASLACARAPE